MSKSPKITRAERAFLLAAYRLSEAIGAENGKLPIELTRPLIDHIFSCGHNRVISQLLRAGVIVRVAANGVSADAAILINDIRDWRKDRFFGDTPLPLPNDAVLHLALHWLHGVRAFQPVHMRAGPADILDTCSALGISLPRSQLPRTDSDPRASLLLAKKSRTTTDNTAIPNQEQALVDHWFMEYVYGNGSRRALPRHLSKAVLKRNGYSPASVLPRWKRSGLLTSKRCISSPRRHTWIVDDAGLQLVRRSRLSPSLTTEEAKRLIDKCS